MNRALAWSMVVGAPVVSGVVLRDDFIGPVVGPAVTLIGEIVGSAIGAAFGRPLDGAALGGGAVSALIIGDKILAMARRPPALPRRAPSALQPPQR